MDDQKCKNCKCIYYRCYYHGPESLLGMFTKRCLWTIKDIDKMDETQCKFYKGGCKNEKETALSRD